MINYSLYCNKTGKLLRCSRCKSTYYCDIQCQSKHREHHKRQCKEKNNLSILDSENKNLNTISYNTKLESKKIQLTKYQELDNNVLIPYFLNKNQTNYIINEWFSDNNVIQIASLYKLISSIYSSHCNYCLIDNDDNFCCNFGCNYTAIAFNKSLYLIG